MSPAPVAGAIILVRHGEPALTRDLWMNAAGYRAWWGQYEVGGLKAGQSPPPALAGLLAPATSLTASTLRRSIESADALAAGRPVDPQPLYVEAPLPPPPLPAWLKLRPRWWGVIARVWWYLLSPAGEESRAAAQRRARAAARALEARAETGEAVVLIAHGYFNLMIGNALKADGWRLTLNQGFHHWCARRFERG